MNKGKRELLLLIVAENIVGRLFLFASYVCETLSGRVHLVFSGNERHVINGMGRTAKASWATEAPTVTSAFLLQ